MSDNTQRTLSVSSFYNPHLEGGPSLAHYSRPAVFSIYLGSSSIDGGNLNEQPDDPLCLGDENYLRRLKVISSVQCVTGAPSVGWKFRYFFFSSTQEDANRNRFAKRWDSVDRRSCAVKWDGLQSIAHHNPTSYYNPVITESMKERVFLHGLYCFRNVRDSR